MKCYESFIVGIFAGMLLLCFIMLNFQAPIKCEVSQYVAGNRMHIIYGVAKAGDAE